MKPIKPSEVQGQKNVTIPDSIIKSVNELIVKYWNGNESTFKQEELMERVLSEDSTLTREQIFAAHLFDFENLFRKEKWVVVYGKPAYNESYPSTFTFSKKDKR